MIKGISKKKYKRRFLYLSFSHPNGFAFLALYSMHFTSDLHNKPKMSPGWGKWL